MNSAAMNSTSTDTGTDTSVINRYFSGLDYPAHRHDLIRIAVAEGATDDELQLLRSLPNRNFTGSSDIRRSIRALHASVPA